MKLIAAALSMCLASAVSWAQGPQGMRGRGPAVRRDEAFRMIDAYIVSNLQESLGLNDEQFVKLLPLVKRLQTDRRALFQRRQQALHELRRLLQSGTATEARVLEVLKEARAAEAEEPARVRQDLEAIDAALTPMQQAKYRVLEIEVEQKIRELMNQIRLQDRPGRERGPGPEPPRQPQ